MSHKSSRNENGGAKQLRFRLEFRLSSTPNLSTFSAFRSIEEVPMNPNWTASPVSSYFFPNATQCPPDAVSNDARKGPNDVCIGKDQDDQDGSASEGESTFLDAQAWR